MKQNSDNYVQKISVQSLKQLREMAYRHAGNGKNIPYGISVVPEDELYSGELYSLNPLSIYINRDKK